VPDDECNEPTDAERVEFRDYPFNLIRNIDLYPENVASHAELEAVVRRKCSRLDVRVYGTRDSRRAERGYPDLTIVGRRGILWRELKTERGKLSSEQTICIYALRAAGGDAGVWRPADLYSGRIAAELAAIMA